MGRGIVSDIDLAQKVAFLKDPRTYPDRPDKVEAIETHMSWVFLTKRFAYKMKKPVRYSFLDFSTLEARHRDCMEEVRLNRRLAEDVYLGTVPLALDDGSMRLEGKGRVIEWLVKMRRLPPQCMLDAGIKQGTVERAAVEKVLEKLSRFYQRSPPEPLSPEAYRERFLDDIASNRETLVAYALPAEGIAALQRGFVEASFDLFAQRVLAGRIIEAHGDLRPEHICLLEEPVIIDCLEFNRDFRILDTADELAFLSMECEHLGAPYIDPWIFETYEENTGDGPPRRLIDFYKAYRATLRAKLSVWHLRECQDTEKWIRRARSYLALAEVYSRRLA